MTRKQIIDVLTEAFDANPSVNWVIKNDAKRKKRIRVLSEYAYKTCKARDGVYLSSNKQGVALCYNYFCKKEGIADYWNQLILAINAIGLSRIGEVLKRESYIKKHRDNKGDFLYFWFFGVSDKGRGSDAAKTLKDDVFRSADEQQLPIYLETSVAKNKRVYERYGFVNYHTWRVEKQGIELWFMKRPPQPLS